MDDSFFRALFPGTHRVLGRTLPALTPWRLLCLHAISSPFVTPGAVATLADIQLAVKCCRARAPHQPAFRLTCRDTWQRFWHEYDAAFVRAQAQLFVDYLIAYQQRPRFWENETHKGKLASAPQILSTVAELQRCTNLTHDEAWNGIAPGYATWLIATIAEQQGAELRFLWEADEEPDERLIDLESLSDADLEAHIAADIGPVMARAFMKRRAERKEAR